MLVSSKVSLPHSQSTAHISPWRVKMLLFINIVLVSGPTTISPALPGGKHGTVKTKQSGKPFFKVIKRCNKLTAWQWLVRFAVVKSTSWSFRGPEFSSQDSHLGTDTHNHLIRAPGRANARASKGTLVHLPTHIYTNEKIKFIKKIAFLCGKHCYYYSDFKWEKEGWWHFLTIPKLLS